MVNKEEWDNVINQLAEKFQFEYLKTFFVEKGIKFGEFMENYVAAKSHHHAYVGGLKQHTYEMLNSFLALVNTGMYSKIIVDYVAISVLYHDTAKKYEYKTTPIQNSEYVMIDYTDYVNLVTHTYGSARILENDIDKIKECSREQKNLMITCILSHHGKKEWGALFEPKTPEAVMVNMLDMLSSQCAKN